MATCHCNSGGSLRHDPQTGVTLTAGFFTPSSSQKVIAAAEFEKTDGSLRGKDRAEVPITAEIFSQQIRI